MRTYSLTPVTPGQKLQVVDGTLVYDLSENDALVTRAGKPGTWRCRAMIAAPTAPPLMRPTVTVQRVLCSPTVSGQIETAPRASTPTPEGSEQ